MTENEKRAFRSFDKKVQELLDSRYLKSAQNTGIQFNFSWNENTGVDQTRVAPDEESIKAFLLTLRFFVQNNERMSIYNISKIVDDLNINSGSKSKFQNARLELNTYLDNPSNVHITFNKIVLTLGEIFMTFLYGLYAHENEEKAKLLETWKMAGIYPLARTEFDNTVLDILDLLSVMRSATNEMLQLEA